MVGFSRSPDDPPPFARRKPFHPVGCLGSHRARGGGSRGRRVRGIPSPPRRFRSRREDPAAWLAPRGTPLGPSGGRVFWATLGRACSRGRPRKRRPRSKSRRFAAFRISRHLSHLAASFVVGRPEVSIVESRFFFLFRGPPPPRRAGRSEGPLFSIVTEGPSAASGCRRRSPEAVARAVVFPRGGAERGRPASPPSSRTRR